MKLYIKIILVVVVAAFTSCEDVIDVPLQSVPARLVVEASLDWEKGTTGNEQTIRLKTSTPYFKTTTETAVTGATVSVANDVNGTVFTFADQNNGDYLTTSFVPVIGHSYTLSINYDGETYTAQETLMGIVDIKEIYQDKEDGFDDEEIEIHIVFDDPEAEENYYFFRFDKAGDLLPGFEVGDDQFINGNEVDWWYELEDDDTTDEVESLAIGDEVTIAMHGTSEDYNNYMEILINQIGGVGLFDTTPVAVKGNCINETTPDNYAHGYFRLTEYNKVVYTVE